LPYVVSLRGSDVPGYSDRFTFVYTLLTPLIKLIWKRADNVVSNSQGLKDLALKTGTKKVISIIYNGIDIKTFCPQPALRPAGSFIITPGASRVTARKGIKYLIEAVGQLAEKYPQIILKIIGDGNEKENLEKLVAEKGLQGSVIFLGRIPHEQVTPYYQEASVFVLPSLNEGMSNAMLEALAVGLPILATDTGGSTELVKDRVNGYIIQMKDGADIAAKLEKILTDENLRASMSRASRELAESLSWEKVARQYFELYGKVKNS
jgi:glycosyltransferase involved in cell wall biosynthesis